MADESREQYIPPQERTTNATPLREWGQPHSGTRQAIPQEEYSGMKRREFITKGAIGLGGAIAAVAGLFGLGKAFERAWFSKEPSIEAGKKAGQDYSRSKPPRVIEIPMELKSNLDPAPTPVVIPKNKIQST